MSQARPYKRASNDEFVPDGVTTLTTGETVTAKEVMDQIKDSQAISRTAAVKRMDGDEAELPIDTYQTYVLWLVTSDRGPVPVADAVLDPKHEKEAQTFIDQVEKSCNEFGGGLLVHTSDQSKWYIIDGHDKLYPPDHLTQARFPFDRVLLWAFPSQEATQQWWTSDSMFHLLMRRQVFSKIGIYMFDGLRSVDLSDKWLYLEVLGMNHFVKAQHYLDLYKRYFAKSILEIGIESHLLFAETPTEIFMSEYADLDAVVASTWRLKTDPTFWYSCMSYQTYLKSLREENSTSLVLAVPFRDPKSKRTSMMSTFF